MDSKIKELLAVLPIRYRRVLKQRDQASTKNDEGAALHAQGQLDTYREIWMDITRVDNLHEIAKSLE